MWVTDRHLIQGPTQVFASSAWGEALKPWVRLVVLQAEILIRDLHTNPLRNYKYVNAVNTLNYMSI